MQFARVGFLVHGSGQEQVRGHRGVSCGSRGSVILISLLLQCFWAPF